MNVMLKISKKYYLWFSVLAMVFGCAKENPNLVNPPFPSETDYIRFFNLAPDSKPRKLVVGKLKETSDIGTGLLSLPIKPPPADSVSIELKLNNVTEYSSNIKMRLIRDTRYVVIGTPKKNSLQPLDTIIVLTTSYSILTNANNCFLTLVNMNTDTNMLYSVVLGCPSNDVIIQQTPFLGISLQKEIISGNISVSILRRNLKDSTTKSLGLFNLNLDPGGEYSLIIQKDGTGEKVQLLNQKDDSQNAIQTIVPMTQQLTANIRLVNFSQSVVDVIKYPVGTEIKDPKSQFDLKKYTTGTIFKSSNPKWISDLKSISVCNSEFLDALIVSCNGVYSSFTSASLDVNNNYSLFVFDSSGFAGKLSILVKPVRVYNTLSDSCMIRVINASYLNNAVTLSLGARDDNNKQNPNGFRSGDDLAKNLVYGTISEPVLLPSGRAPISLYTATAPQNLITSAIGYFKSGGKYIITVTSNKNGTNEISIIEDNDKNMQIVPLAEGVYTQFAHFIPGVRSAFLQIPGILTNAKIYYSSSLATVMPVGNNSLTFNNTSFNFSSDLQNRDLIIAAGSPTATDIFSVKSLPMDYDDGSYKRRCINACREQPVLNVYTDTTTDKKGVKVNKIADKVLYGFTQSDINFSSGTLERKTALYFYNTLKDTLLQRIEDISFVRGKNYSIIFGGSLYTNDPNTNGYSIILLQEY